MPTKPLQQLFKNWYRREVLDPRLRQQPQLATFIAEHHKNTLLNENLVPPKNNEEAQARSRHFEKVADLFPDQVQGHLKGMTEYTRHLDQRRLVRFSNGPVLEEREFVRALKRLMEQPTEGARVVDARPSHPVIYVLQADFELYNPEAVTFEFVLQNEASTLDVTSFEVDVLPVMDDDQQTVQAFLKRYPPIQELPSQQREQTIRSITGEASPVKRWRRLQNVFDSSGMTYYQRLAEALLDPKDQLVSSLPWVPEDATAILKHAHLADLLEGGSLSEVTERLVSDHPLPMALDALLALPVPLPVAALERFRDLPEEEQLLIVAHLNPNLQSPTGLAHLLTLLDFAGEVHQELNEFRVHLKQHLLSPDFWDHVHGFHHLLHWLSYSALDRTRDWPAPAVLVALWEHAHEVHLILRNIGVPTDHLENLTRTPLPISARAFMEQNAEVQYDAAYPQQFDPQTFYVTLLMQSLSPQDTSRLAVTPEGQKLFWKDQPEGEPALLNAWMALRQQKTQDLLGTFLNPSREAILEAYLSEHCTENFKRQYAQFGLQAVWEKDTWDLTDWTVLFQNVSSAPTEAQALKVQEQVLNLNFEHLDLKTAHQQGVVLVWVSQVLSFTAGLEDARMHVLDLLRRVMGEQTEEDFTFAQVLTVTHLLAMNAETRNIDQVKLTQHLEDVLKLRPDLGMNLLEHLGLTLTSYGNEAPMEPWNLMLRLRAQVDTLVVSAPDHLLLTPLELQDKQLVVDGEEGTGGVFEVREADPPEPSREAGGETEA